MKQSGMWTLKQALAVLGLLRVWVIWYISAIPIWRKDIDNLQSNIQSTSGCICGYLLALSFWRSHLNFIPKKYLLLLHRSQQGYFSFEVLSCTFIIQFYITDISLTLYSWILQVPSSKQEIDQKNSNWMVGSLKEVWGLARWHGDPQDTSARILLSQHYSFCWGETTLLFLIDKSILGVVAFLDSKSLSISAGCWDDTFASDGSLRVIMIVWWFKEYFFLALRISCTSAYW